MSMLITGATVIDAVADAPLAGQSILIEGGRIRALGRRDELRPPPDTEVIEAHGKFVIPGLMNANVHLLMDTYLEVLVRYEDRYVDLIFEAAQVALKNGLTTVFDTWGPRRFLLQARDRIRAGEAHGSRIFCAGNIVGFDGPFSQDFRSNVPQVATAALVKRINAMWVENVGRHLMWLTPQQIATEVRAYITKGIDFIKYGSNEHFNAAAGAFLAFSHHQQTAIVAEAHRAGIPAQAHAMSVEGLRLAVEAGCDLVTHCNITGPVAIPDPTLEMMANRKTGAVIFALSERRLEWLRKNEAGLPDLALAMWEASDTNTRNLIRSGAPLLLANDGAVLSPESLADPLWWTKWRSIDENDIYDLAQGHFAWFRAMEEKGCAPLEILRAATRNIAAAYGKDEDLGTLEPGKIADLLILDKNPLEAAENYRSIHTIIKDGSVVDREKLPVAPILTRPMRPPAEEEAAYIPFLRAGAAFPMCPCTHG